MSHPTPRLLVAALIASLAARALRGEHDGPSPRQIQQVRADEIQRMILQLGDDKFLNRERATRRLMAIGQGALPWLRDALNSRDAEVARRAQHLVAEIQNSLPYLTHALKETDAQMRKEAALALERLGPKAKEALPMLLDALKDPEESVRDSVVSAVLAIDPLNQSVAEVVPAKAHVNGKYAKLLRRIKCPDDRQSYSDYRDFGYYQQCDWAGYTNIPAGYWVYVYPYWYIWGTETKDK
jgi:hypothetical protein